MYTYNSLEEQLKDKSNLNQLLILLNASKACLKLDECRCYCLSGSRGKIYSYSINKLFKETDFILVYGSSPEKWTYLKKRLKGYKVTQDGDNEGCIKFNYLSSDLEFIRKTLGIRKSREGGIVDNLKAKHPR